MATKTITFESFAVGATPDGAALGVTAASGLTITDANPGHGLRAATIASGGLLRDTVTGATKVATRHVLRVPTQPTAEYDAVRLTYSGDVNGVIVRVTAAKTLRLLAAGATIWTSTAVVPDGEIELATYIEAGTSSTTGVARVAAYLKGSNTPISGLDSGSQSGINTANGATFNMLRIGQTGGTLPASGMQIDTVQYYTDGDATGIPAAYTVAAAATVRPASVSANPGAWVNQAGAASTGAALADEDDTTYNTNPGTTTAEAITYSLPPLSNGAVTISIKALKPSGTVAPIRIELLEGTTVRATRNIIDTTATAAYDSGTNIATYTLDLTSGENTAITSRTNLSVRITANPA